jgi:hypothetical protein
LHKPEELTESSQHEKCDPGSEVVGCNAEVVVLRTAFQLPHLLRATLAVRQQALDNFTVQIQKDDSADAHGVGKYLLPELKCVEWTSFT